MKEFSIRKHLWWVIPNQLAGMPLPHLSEMRRNTPNVNADAFDDDLRFLAEIGIKSIVAALSLPKQKELFENCGFHYLSLDIPDGFPPSLEQADRMVSFYIGSPLPMAVHCEGGIGRTGTLLAVLLVHQGRSSAEAIRMIKAVMPPALEIPAQVDFVYRCEKHLKARGNG